MEKRRPGSRSCTAGMASFLGPSCCCPANRCLSANRGTKNAAVICSRRARGIGLDWASSWMPACRCWRDDGHWSRACEPLILIANGSNTIRGKGISRLTRGGTEGHDFGGWSWGGVPASRVAERGNWCLQLVPVWGSPTFSTPRKILVMTVNFPHQHAPVRLDGVIYKTTTSTFGPVVLP